MKNVLSCILVLLVCMGCQSNNNDNVLGPNNGLVECEGNYTEIDGKSYYQCDIDVLQDIIDANDFVGGVNPLSVGGDECGRASSDDYPLGCQQWNSSGRLKGINLDERLVTVLPESIGLLTELEELYIREGLLDSLPNSLYDLHKLKVLVLDNNPLTDLSDKIVQLSDLRTLGLYASGITRLPYNIGELTKLEWLIVSSSNLVVLPESVCDLPAGCKIYVEDNCLCNEPSSYDCSFPSTNEQPIIFWGEQECGECGTLNRGRATPYSHINNKSIQLSINKETNVYTTDYILPDHAPYVMEIDVIAKASSKGKLTWYTDKEYVINECPDDWECPYIFDLMSDSTTYINKRGLSKNTILVSPEFANDTIYIYSYFTNARNNIQYRDSVGLVLEW